MAIQISHEPTYVSILLTGLDRALTLRGSIVVPLANIEEARAEAPRWPTIRDGWRIGTHLPGLVAKGTFTAWNGATRRFFFLTRSDRTSLVLRLRGHPTYNEIILGVPDAEDQAARIQREIAKARAR